MLVEKHPITYICKDKTYLMTSSEHNSFDLISFLWLKKTTLISIGILAAISSAIVSLIIEEKFESTVTLYPTKTSSVTFNQNITED